MCVLSIKVPIQKKSGNLFNDPHIYIYIYIYIYIDIYLNDRSHFHFKWQGSKIIRPVHIHWQQYLIYWKWYQHMPRGGLDHYWQVIDDMEVWYLWQNKMWFLPRCGSFSTTVWMYHLDTNKMHVEKARW